jgi:hypothetical protein
MMGMKMAYNKLQKAPLSLAIIDTAGFACYYEESRKNYLRMSMHGFFLKTYSCRDFCAHQSANGQTICLTVK